MNLIEKWRRHFMAEFVTPYDDDQAEIRDSNEREINALCDQALAQPEGMADARELLRRIAYEPWGPAEASHAEVLELITEVARAFLAAPQLDARHRDYVAELRAALEGARKLAEEYRQDALQQFRNWMAERERAERAEAGIKRLQCVKP